MTDAILNITEQEIMKNWKSDLKKPLVSIGCITYNHEKFIAEALDSFLMQKTDFPFEIVIDDDCSTDNTAKIIQRYINKYPKIINANLRTKNVGMTKNASESISRANGTYLAICEGDDYWIDVNKLQYQITKMLQHPELSISVHPAKEFIEHTQEYSGVIRDMGADTVFKFSDLLKLVPFATSSMIIKKDVFDKHSKIFEKIPFTESFVQIIASSDNGILYLNKVMSCYRVHMGGIWTSNKNNPTHLKKLISLLVNSINKIDQYLNYKYKKEFQQLQNSFICFF